jgi:signal transduction histidine kinase
LPKVFDQFFRVEKSRSPLLGGVGLGLTIAREIIHLHKGTITIESEINGWTKVLVVLPKTN